MNVTFDPYVFTQIGLDSGSLTILGTIVHSFAEPGEYRGVVHYGADVKATFVIRADKESPTAQVSIDLASLVPGPGPDKPHPEGCSCCGGGSGEQVPHKFVVNPRGYVLFHVSRGAGGYYVHVRRTGAEERDKGYDSRTLAEGDVFTAIVLRPGAYSIANTMTGAKGELVVNYPKIAEKREERRYRPPAPVRVICTKGSMEPNKLQLDPGQGIIFENRVPGRLVIKLEKPDDGPKAKQPAPRPGRIANRLR